MTHYNRMPSPARLRGFTLIELLVVVSIIAMLVTMLLPVLSSARKVAQLTICSSQLRQQGIGLNAYTNDYNGYYPLFGGALGGPDPYGRSGTLNNWGTFIEDTAVYNDFGTYIGLITDGNLNPTNSLAKIKYCPLVNWNWDHFGTYTYINPPYYAYYWAGLPGYGYYTGRSLSGSSWANFNTINRRYDPKEILMTDLLEQATQDEDWRPSGYNTQVSTAFPWFNPHVDRSCQATPTGQANHLTADGHVVALDFNYNTITYLSADYAISYFSGHVVGPVSSDTDGPYAAIW